MSFKPDKYALFRKELLALIEELKELRPEDRSEEARYVAITITDLEKVFAFVESYLNYK